MQTNSLQLFDTRGRKIDPIVETVNDEKVTIYGQQILCAICRHIITSEAESTSVQNNHYHTCTNPAGLVFDIRCFKNAPGCRQVGPAYSEYTWFVGYHWQITICGSCSEHLGWLYKNSNTFFGLIANRLLYDS